MAELIQCEVCGELTIGYRSYLWHACCCQRCYNRRYRYYRRHQQEYMHYRIDAQHLATRLLMAFTESPFHDLWQMMPSKQHKLIYQCWTDIITRFLTEHIPLAFLPQTDVAMRNKRLGITLIKTTRRKINKKGREKEEKS